jgi:hypothetical protein
MGISIFRRTQVIFLRPPSWPLPLDKNYLHLLQDAGGRVV